MIEVIYKEEKTIADEEVSSFTIPRNIRQVGLVGENFRIYMEDYVYTFLKKLSEKRGSVRKGGYLAILKGETRWKNEITYIFVRGAVLVDAKEVTAEQIALSEENWEQIHREEEAYFPDDETVGWFYSEPDLPMRMSSTFDSVHLKYFGADKICMLMDPTEKEEAFFRYENSSLIRQCGYYLYYEKNPRMQTYMIEKKQELSETVEEPARDEAVKAFRKRIVETADEEKQSTASSLERGGFLGYAATACLAFAVFAAGLNFYRSYRTVNQESQSVQSASSEAVLSASVTPAAVSDSTGEKDLSDASKKKTISQSQVDTTKVSKSVSPAAETDTKKTDTETQKTDEPAEKLQEEADSKDPSLRVEDDLTEETGRTDTSAAAGPMHETYVIRPGDTLFQICLEHYGTLDRLQKLCELNGISENDLIYPGEIIVLP